MKILRFKKILFASFTVGLTLFPMVFSLASAKIDYNAPVPLGIHIDLVEGLSEEEAAKAKEAYYNDASGEAQINRIYENFLMSIDQEKYFAGSYWDGIGLLLDENGERILDERGKPLKTNDRDLYIMVTDLKIVPKEINHPRIFFRKAKYSYAQIKEFMEIIWNKFVGEGDSADPSDISAIDFDVITNKINIYVVYGFDINKFKELIPEDAYYCTFVEEDAFKGASV